MGSTGQRIALVFAIGAIFMAVSEMWFHQVTDVNLVALTAAYGVLGYLSLAVFERFRVRTLAGLFLVAATFGFLIEGVAVSVLYSGLPLSIVWTSLAWHALVTVGLGWLGFRRFLTHGNAASGLAFCGGFGVLLGAWSAYLWNAVEVEGTSSVTYEWISTSRFALQFLLGYVMFVAGHLVFQRVWSTSFGFTRLEYLALLALAAVGATLTTFEAGLVAFLPLLPILVGTCLWALHRAQQRPVSGRDVRRFVSRPIRWQRLWVSLAIPAGAIGTYNAIVSQQLEVEMNVYFVGAAGSISVVLLIWALWKNALPQPRPTKA